MTKKHKRSPYDDVTSASGVLPRAAKHARPSHVRAKPAHDALLFEETSGHREPPPHSRNNLTPTNSGQQNVTQPQAMSIEVLEQKKMLLPYLDKIEYINIQLRQRGLLPDEDTATSRKTDSSTSINQGEASPSAAGASSVAAPLPRKSLSHQHSDSHLMSASKTATTQIATERLGRRYPRLFGTISQPRRAALSPRLRPINWLLHLIEEIYDELTDLFILGKSSDPNSNNKTATMVGDGDQSNNDISPRPEELLDSKRTPGAGASPAKNNRLFQTKLVMPFLVRKHLDHTLGLVHLADQECLDLLYNTEMELERFPQVALFALFVREIYDDDTLLFFLFLRHLMQKEFDLLLQSKAKLAHSSTTGKKFVAKDLVMLVAHPLIPDGSKTVLMTKSACELVWRRLFCHTAELQGENKTTEISRGRGAALPAILSQYLTTEKMASLFENHNEVALENVLIWGVDAFRSITEDIIAQYKYNDDGESLRSLLRLRDTISSDAKIDKLQLLFSDQERKLRTMKIETMRLERSNTDDNKNRIQLRLLRNQISLLEQELQHIQTQILTAESLVNNVWQEVVATKSPTRSKMKKPSHMKPRIVSEYIHGSRELPSVLARFEAHIARLQRKHDIEVKAAAVLAKPWKQQMEELQLKMVIKIQRAYRARKKAQQIKQHARDQLHEQLKQRERHKQQVAMNNKRQAATQEKDLQRHQARMVAKREQEETARAAVQAKQRELLDKIHQEQIVQRDQERNAKQMKKMFSLWHKFVDRRKQKRGANRLFLKFQFMKWKHHFAHFQRLQKAATLIQRVYRRRCEKQKLRKAAQHHKKRSAMAARYLCKIQQRRTHQVFTRWVKWSSYRLQLKENFKAIIQRRQDEWFQKWVEFVTTYKKKRLDAVLLVQRMFRGHLARQVFKHQRQRNTAASEIQRLYRGFKGRQVGSLRRQIKIRQDNHCGELLRRIQLRGVYVCLVSWRGHAERTRHIKFMAERRKQRLVRDVFLGGIAGYRQYKKDKRAALLKLQYESAVFIQRHYRRHRCQVIFRVSLQSHRAAIQIQRIVRGFQGRQRVWKFRWEIDAARKLQTAWRRRQAKRLAEKTRAEAILLAAYKGDFTATQRAITMGFWYVMDAECNGIFHMAAAAGHKRLVKLCFRHQFDVNAVNQHGQTPLHLLLANLPPPNSVFLHDDEASHTVVDRVASAAYMIDHGAWHEAADIYGLTPLLLTAGLGQTEATEMLLERSADTETRSTAGLNALQLAVEGNHAPTVRVLLASGGFAGEHNSHDTLRLLHVCAGRGLLDCLRVLLDHLSVFPLADDQWDRRDDDGYTPLIYAISNAHTDTVQCLLEHGANPDEKDFFGRSPLHFAVSVGESGSPAIVQVLTTYDVDVDVKDTDGDAALHVSCDRDDRLGCTALLLRHGAFIGANALGNHPSHIASHQGAVQTLKMLVEYGADMNIKNYQGKTPLGMARMKDQKAIVQFIKQYFATEDVDHEDGDRDGADNGDGNVVAKDKQLPVDEASTDDTPTVDEHPLRTPEEWELALQTAFKMGTLAEWTHYVDAKTEISFFACDDDLLESLDSGDAAHHHGHRCTWETPIEFGVSLGDAWEVMRGGGSGVASRSRLPPQLATTDGEVEEEEEEAAAATVGSLPRLRAGNGVQYFYHNKHTGEMRTKVPPIDYSLLQDAVQNSKRHQQLRQKIRRVSDDASASAMEYMRFFHEFEAESNQTRHELHASIVIQRHFRAKRTKRMLKMLLQQNKCAIELQRAFRGRQARQFAARKRFEHIAATQIQALWRGHAARQHETRIAHQQRVTHLRRRQRATQIQRLFRGHWARKLAYRERVVQRLGPKGYFAWEQARRRAICVQSFKVWDEMELRDEFPGVFFYCHQVTRSCAWEKPKEWQAHDVDQFLERKQLSLWGYTQAMKQAAIRLQCLWRARQARISFRLLLKSIQLMRTSEKDYLEDPTSLVKMGNYVLYLHAIVHDYERARPLYARLMRTMAQRGPDVAFILFSYGIFLYVTHEDDVSLVEEMILRGKLVDRQLVKYKMAFLGFFRQSMLQNPLDSESNLNYGACLQWLFGNYEEATLYYLRAIAANPHNKRPMALFQGMLTRKRQIDKHSTTTISKKTRQQKEQKEQEDDWQAQQYDGYELFRRWQVRQAEQDDLRRKQEYDAAVDAEKRQHAAKQIQARYRRRRAMRTVNRTKVARRMALSMAELSTTKAVYERVQLAFGKLDTSTSVPMGMVSSLKAKIKTKTGGGGAAPTMSLPMARLEEIFQAMDLSLSPQEMATTLTEFHAQYLKYGNNARNVNVMDVTSFAQSHPLLAERLLQATKKQQQPPETKKTRK